MSPQITHMTFSSHIGPMMLRANHDALISLDFVTQNICDSPCPFLEGVRIQINEYLSGKRRKFDVPVLLEGTEFQVKVWTQLLNVPFGEVITYGSLSRAIGYSKGARAVGRALNQNPLPIIVPCHRVIGANGDLTGYAGGIDRKRALLALKQVSGK